MRELSSHINADLLIYRYKNGNISPKDEQKLLHWVKDSQDNRNYFKSTSRLISSLGAKDRTFDAKIGFDSFMAETSSKRQSFHFSNLSATFLRIAAAIILILGITYLVSQTFVSPASQLVMATEKVLEGQTLPDNTIVTLNKGAALVYPKKFKGEKREVKLEGDAFFEVQRIEDKPFIVNVGNVVIEVLGTSFDVTEDKIQQLITVTVETGSVKVTCDELGFEKILAPNEQCSLRFGNQAEVEESVVQNKNHLSWMTGILDFEETRLEEVVNELNKIYDKDLVIGSELIKNCKLTTKINNYPLPEVIEMLEQTLDLQVVENEQAFILLGEGCYN